MYEVYVVSSIGAVVLAIALMYFLFWFMKYYTNAKYELDKHYNLVEIGYLRKLVEKDLDLEKVKVMLNNQYDNKVRKKLEEKIIKKYIDDLDKTQ